MKKLLVVFITVILSACVSIKPEKQPLLSPFGDGTQWVVMEDLVFSIKTDAGESLKITVPKGFVTDLASTPREIWSLYPPFGKYLTASILHDYLYWRGTCTQNQSDKILYQTMRDAGVDQATQSRFYVILSEFGEKAWEQNKSERDLKLIRVIPPNYINTSSISNWAEYRSFLKANGISEFPVSSDNNLPTFCAVVMAEIKVNTGLMALLGN